MSGIKRVHVIYKTHLDIGYTNMGQTVLDSYVQEHIPHAIDLALKINTPEHKKFIWTVGSFLADYYKRHATPEQLEKMDEAIRLGYFRWHGLAVTSHTELQSPEVLAYNLSVSRKLDREYGVHTIAAKMTDVPGHTIALVRPLSGRPAHRRQPVFARPACSGGFPLAARRTRGDRPLFRAVRSGDLDPRLR